MMRVLPAMLLAVAGWSAGAIRVHGQAPSSAPAGVKLGPPTER